MQWPDPASVFLLFFVGDAVNGTRGNRLFDTILIPPLGRGHIGLIFIGVKGKNIRAQFDTRLTTYTFFLIDLYLFHRCPHWSY
jgi:hypothetical protein